MMQAIVVVNPLGAALKHYTTELVEVLRAAGWDPEVLEQGEPSSSGRSRVSWLVEHLRLIRRAARSHGGSARVLVTWPAVGHLDALLLWALARRRGWLIVHDPEPLVTAVGYGPLSRILARLFARTPYVAHSTSATQVLDAQGFGGRVTLLPHPSLPPHHRDSRPSQRPLPEVAVFGQFKPDRDVPLLAELGAVLADRHSLSIYGRGWPQVPGWALDDRFIPEEEFDDLIASADVVLIPYRRFFQSGIAIRCMELGVPVVGPGRSSLVDVLGEDSPLLAKGDSTDAWVEAIQSGTNHGQALMQHLEGRYWSGAIDAWSRWRTSRSGV